MEQELFKRLVGRLSRGAFTEFVTELFNDGAVVGEVLGPFGPLQLNRGLPPPSSERLDGLLCQPLLDSYGGSIHQVYILYYCPLELAIAPQSIDVNDPYLQDKLQVVRAQYEGRVGQFGMVAPNLSDANALNSLGLLTNLVGFEREDYEAVLLQRFVAELRRLGVAPDTALVGSYDSFFELNPKGAEAAFERFIARHRDGIRVSLSGEDVQVSSFVNERNLFGLPANLKYPYEPVFVPEPLVESRAISELQILLRSSSSEREIEEFLARLRLKPTRGASAWRGAWA